MKSIHFIFTAPILAICSCTMTDNVHHVSPSGKYGVYYGEARLESDSYYQLVDYSRPDFQFSSISGASPLKPEDIFWSPSEKTCAIMENRPGWVGLENSEGIIRVLHIVRIREDREYEMIYMKPFERKNFNRSKSKISFISDESIGFQSVNDGMTKSFSIENLFQEGREQHNCKDHEVVD